MKPSANEFVAGLLFGLGLVGFLDGILLHHIFQWHHMLSSVIPIRTLADMHVNMLADGLFDALAWLLVVGGLAVLWQRIVQPGSPPSPRRFLGALLLGGGAFNVGEGIIDHHLLRLHHVLPGPNELAWDLGFLAVGALLALGGWWLLRTA